MKNVFEVSFVLYTTNHKTKRTNMPKHQNTPPPAGFHIPSAPSQGGPNVVLIQPANITQVTVLPKNEVHMTCPSCQQSITSKVDFEATSKTHCWACVCFFFLCWPCCWIPYCMKSCRRANHKCPKCGAYLGSSLN